MSGEPPISWASNPASGALLRAVGISKRFGGTQALRDVDLQMQKGEIVSIVGENGAGKSTFVKIISGMIPAGGYSGEFSLREDRCQFRSIAEAEARGVVLIPQELQVAPGLSIAENMLAGHLPTRWGLVDGGKRDSAVSVWLEFFDLKYRPDTPLGELSPSEQRLVVISGALSRRAQILILDEPTVALTPHEVQRLFTQIRRLRDSGTAILYITHALDELHEIADRVVVLRNGTVTANLTTNESVTRSEIIRAMLGKDLIERTGRKRRAWRDGAAPIMRVSGLTVRERRPPRKAVVIDVSFELHRREILGFFGLIGCGAQEALAATFGVAVGRRSGQIEVGGVPTGIRSPQDAVDAGIVMVSGDRQSTGLFQQQSVAWNISASSTRSVSWAGFLISESREEARNWRLVRQLRVVTRSLTTKIDDLSGGNQQKCLLARCLATNPKILLLEEPTMGIDVGSRVEIYEWLQRLAEDGTGVVLVSSDVGEIQSQCNRILVFRKGQVVAERDAATTSRELLVHLAAGERDPSCGCDPSAAQ